ncbi:hypothetical protein ACQBAU_06140 [Propionibacteriaceae bacterium Y2011]|uniref:hypothetical protein n=1 Tax=Microlunatus sp. Y2014 TaxID=3418488 RepID=UPI003B4AF203
MESGPGWGAMVDEHVEGVELLIRAPAAVISRRLADGFPGRVAALGVRLHRYEDRGAEGGRYVLTGLLVGTGEWWLETLPPSAATPDEPAVVVHAWFRGRATRNGRGDPVRHWPGLLGWPGRRRTTLTVRATARRFRQLLFQLRRELS